MLTSETTHLAAADETGGRPASRSADFSRLELDAIVARAAHVRAVERGRLLRAAWFALLSLWRKSRLPVPEET